MSTQSHTPSIKDNLNKATQEYEMSTPSYTSTPRITVGNYPQFGRQIVEWSKMDPEDRPKTIGEVRKQLCDANVEFPPERFKDEDPVRFVQSQKEGEWLVRLPPLEMVEASLKQIESGAGEYLKEYMPEFYTDYVCKGHSYDADLLYSRIADYTVGQCA